MRKVFIYILFFLLILSACSKGKVSALSEPIDTIPEMVRQIQKRARLYVTEYHIHKIITHDDTKALTGRFMGKDFSVALPLGSRKVAIPLEATLKAYIDFAGLPASNVRRHGEKVEIVLPDPRFALTATKVNHEEVRQYVPLTRSDFTDEELSTYERHGRQAIIEAIPAMEVMETAREGAASILIPLIEQMGFERKNITVTFRRKYALTDVKRMLSRAAGENSKTIQ